MRLSAEQYEQIVAALRSDQSRQRQADKRTAPRVGLRMKLQIIPCIPTKTPQKLLLRIRDISGSGIGLLHSEPMLPGTFFLAGFLRGNGQSLMVLYRVVRCKSVGHRQFTIGATFERLITPEMLNQVA
jgi:hypothetical protein